MYRITFLIGALGCGSSPQQQGEALTATGETLQVATHASAEALWVDYGAPLAGSVTLGADVVLEAPQDYVGQTVRVAGTVSDVCQKKGCWMILSEGDRHMRVLMKDHKFAVDKAGAGRQCEVEGSIVAKVSDPETTAHYASESTKGAPVPEHDVIADEVVYHFVATGVRMRQTSL